MALDNTTFTALTTGTRDDTLDKGAQYYLDGNTTNGRLNISAGATWMPGLGTCVLIDGDPSHSYMNGIIQAESFVYGMLPSLGGRGDYNSPTSTLILKNSTFLFLGLDDVVLHLTGASDVFSGNTNLLIDMAVTGVAKILFGPNIYENFKIEALPGNLGDIQIFPNRSVGGFSSLPNFKLQGFTVLTLKVGTNTQGHARIYDPVYTGLANNLIPMIAVGAFTEANKEYFSIDVSLVADSLTNMLVTNEDVEILFSGALTALNTTILATDGITPVEAYSGKNIVLVKVREATTTLSSVRKQIAYSIRRNGFIGKDVALFDMNTPIMEIALTVDLFWSNTGIITDITTALELYDEFRKYLTENMGEQFEFSRTVNTVTVDKNIIFDDTAPNLISFDGTTITVKVISFSDNITSLGGTFVASNSAVMLGFVTSTTQDSRITVTTPAGFDNDIDIYGSKSDAENETNQLFTGSVIVYLSSTYGGQVFWFRLTHADTSFIVEDYLVPVAAGDYAVNLITSNTDNAIAEILIISKKLDGLIEDSSGNRFTVKALETGLADVSLLGLEATNQTILIKANTLNNYDDTVINTKLDTVQADLDNPTQYQTDLTPVQSSISALNDFNPVTDVVANVALVATTTTNTDMIASNEYDARMLALQASLDNTTQYQADLAPITALINGLNNISSADVTAAVPTTAEIEAALLNEGDGQQLIDAIVSLINTNLDLPALELAAIADAVRTNLTVELARIDANVSSAGGDDAATVTAAVRVDLERTGGMLETTPSNVWEVDKTLLITSGSIGEFITKKLLRFVQFIGLK